VMFSPTLNPSISFVEAWRDWNIHGSKQVASSLQDAPFF